MVFVDRNRRNEEDDALPGAGLHLDLERRLCPECGREAAPWEQRCPRCGTATLTPQQMPADQFPLPPGLRDLAEDAPAEPGDMPEDGSAS